MRRYEPKQMEPHWQKIWDKNQTYKAELKSKKPKYIAMSMFNYPSGAGIHIGHAMNYTISDVKARSKRQQGYESYHPIGWDAFGLPAENYAIKAGVSPQESMRTIIPGYHKQYKAMAWSNDWSKEISTHDSEYYKWTQWIFSEMYRRKLAYQDSRMQWWCEKCQTVLANEQVIDGKCWRHDGPNDPLVEKKEVKQWFFKITDYADELLEAIDDLDWSDSVKLAQQNWIGKSVGAEIIFKIDGTNDKIPVFTTRPDTLFGATFMVLAPEHELVEEITKKSEKDRVDKYVQKTQKKTEIERQAGKEKTGVFTGAYAINPGNNEKIPIWIADYVLTGYGTGAIMSVPAHDERDFEFAKKHKLPVVSVIKNPEKNTLKGEIFTEEGVMKNSGKYDGIKSEDAREKIVADLKKAGQAKEKINYRMRDWSVSRQRYWGAPIPIINCQKCGEVLVSDDQLPVTLPELDDFQPSGDGRSALARAKDWLNTTCPKCGGKAERETDTLDTYIDSSWYFYRYFDPKNQNKIFDSDIVKKWEPIDFYNGADHATAHLLYARFIARFFTKIGLVKEPEPFKKFLFNGKVVNTDGQMFSKSKGVVIDPLEIIDQGYGADALRTYLMFAAPLDLWVRWDPKGVPGTYRFLSRVWNLTQEYLESNEGKIDDKISSELLSIAHKTIKKVTSDIEKDKFNTAIASMMEAVNHYFRLKESNSITKNKEWKFAIESLLQILAPFAPHITEELWSQLGHKLTIHVDAWPQWDDKYLVSDKMRIVVQVNGKVRANILVPTDASEDQVIDAAKSDEKVANQLNKKEVRKTIYVPQKLVNFVV